MKLLLVSGWAVLALLCQTVHGRPISVTGCALSHHSTCTTPPNNEPKYADNNDEDVLYAGSSQQHGVSKRDGSSSSSVLTASSRPRKPRNPFSLKLGEALEDEFISNGEMPFKEGMKNGHWRQWLEYKPDAVAQARRRRARRLKKTAVRAKNTHEADLAESDPLAVAKPMASKAGTNTPTQSQPNPQSQLNPQSKVPSLSRLPSPPTGSDTLRSQAETWRGNVPAVSPVQV